MKTPIFFKITSIFVLVFFLFLLSGCSVKYEHIALDENNQLMIYKTTAQTVENIEKLTQLIETLSVNIDKKDAHTLAKNTIYYAMHLANSYDLVTPAYFQNFLVNQKERQRGLCHHWVVDILSYLNPQDYPTLGIYRVVANKGDYFLEHHAISITAKGAPFDQGIVLDAWRNSGVLFFAPIKEDKSYQWREKTKIQ